MQKVMVSACLLGVKCRYDGKSAFDARTEQLKDICELVPVCPEALGGLPAPRESAEARGARVYTKSGADVTREFAEGARAAAALAQSKGCAFALLKDKSPSCGAGQIYDGSFEGKLIPGDGLTAQALKHAGINVFPASRIEDLIAILTQNKPKSVL